MHQSFVTTAPPPMGKGGDYDFSAFSGGGGGLQMTGALHEGLDGV